MGVLLANVDRRTDREENVTKLTGPSLGSVKDPENCIRGRIKSRL